MSNKEQLFVITSPLSLDCEYELDRNQEYELGLKYHVPYNGPVFHRPLPPTNCRPPTNPSSYIPPHRRPTYNTAYQSRASAFNFSISKLCLRSPAFLASAAFLSLTAFTAAALFSLAAFTATAVPPVFAPAAVRPANIKGRKGKNSPSRQFFVCL
ncbi:hypothetical protein LOTGIDRAFT_163793 [Lottia gigantea]|uniref:Uncharacterized protein n=1 Tax=Lottia gigantea TaxID=225164 RepID=V4A7C6_LOTGI|nr:hypothetical protein LOTGIDRAFT_163793 [Lottia gigantea]ESO90905.1 hypothetical protein LOTGIDRAFT_163793 [Lottia gigantea]